MEILAKLIGKNLHKKIPVAATVEESRVRKSLRHGLIELTKVARPLSTLQR